MSQNSPKAIYIHGSTPIEQERLSALNRILNDQYIKALSLQEGEKILDVGSGLGQFSQLLAEKTGENGRVIGIERDEAQLNQANSLVLNRKNTVNIEYRKGNAYQLPLRDKEWGQFDIVHARFLLEHLSKPQKAIRQMIKAIRPGGRIILADDDHSTFRPTPEPPGFSIIWKAYCRSYERLGNDPYIGRHLVSLLYRSGITKYKNGSVFFGGCKGEEKFELVADNLTGILEGARALILEEGLLDKYSFETAIKNLKYWKTLPDAALNYSIDWVEGIK